MDLNDVSGKLPTTSWDFQEPDWLLIHRAHLHTALRNLAIGEEGEGKPVTLKLACRIVDMDIKTATVRLHTGEEISGDLVIGADGVGSWTRKFIAPDAHTYSSGKCCYRWLVPLAEFEKHEALKKFAALRGRMIEWSNGDRRVMMYPCAGNTLYNCGVFIPKEEAPKGVYGWDHVASKQALLESYSNMGDEVLQVFSLVPEDGLRVWELNDMDFLPTYVKDSLALIRDAAHPFLPYMGQGAAMAIEDVVALAALLPLGVSPEVIPSRLELYIKARKERVEKILMFTRLNGHDMNDPTAPRLTYEESLAGMKYCREHDAWVFAKKVLEESQE